MSIHVNTGLCRLSCKVFTQTVKANSHRHARHGKTVLYVSRPLRRCELDSGQLKSVANRKFEVWTRSEQSSHLRQHTKRNTDRTVLSCLLWQCELSQPDHPTSAFSVRVFRTAVRPPDALRRETHQVLSGGRAESIHTAWHDTDSTVLCMASGVNWALECVVMLWTTRAGDNKHSGMISRPHFDYTPQRTVVYMSVLRWTLENADRNAFQQDHRRRDWLHRTLTSNWRRIHPSTSFTIRYEMLF